MYVRKENLSILEPKNASSISSCRKDYYNSPFYRFTSYHYNWHLFSGGYPVLDYFYIILILGIFILLFNYVLAAPGYIEKCLKQGREKTIIGFKTIKMVIPITLAIELLQTLRHVILLLISYQPGVTFLTLLTLRHQNLFHICLDHLKKRVQILSWDVQNLTT